jgi:hypothetical protein
MYNSTTFVGLEVSATGNKALLALLALLCFMEPHVLVLCCNDFILGYENEGLKGLSETLELY